MTTPTRTSPPVGPLEAVGSTLSLASRNITKLRKSPGAILDVTLQPLLMLFMFTLLFSGAIGGGDRDGYLQQLVPGLMVFSPLYVTIGTGVALCTDISKGFFDRLRSLPIARSAPLAGIVIGDVARYLVSVTVVLAVGMLMGFRVHTNPVAVLASVGLMITFGLCICWMAILVGILLDSPAAVPGVLIGAVMPLSFGSNVFAAADSMPGWVQVWVNINPVTLMTDVNRALLLGEGQVMGPLLGGLAWMAGFVAVFFPLSMRAYRRRLGR
ncbi:ABC transporter permease [Streptomyces sp. NPDC056004]|uniref:ABC transporter permease n=1 Tax=unclassified Streptomyces TaxID=2593676 RepID=UPI0035D79D72